MKPIKYAFFVAEDFNLGAAYVIADLKKQGHEVKLFFDPLQYNRGYARFAMLARLLSIKGYLLSGLKKYNPDIIYFTCVTATYRWALDMAYRVKSELPVSHIVFGGVHPTLCKELVEKEDCVDEVHAGDYFNGNFKPDELWPDREIFFKELPPEHRRTQLFMTSFGCPFNCSFCGNEQLRKINQYKPMRRSVAGCIEELKHLKENGMRYVLFVDDILISDRAWFKKFAAKYKAEIDLPYACFVHPKFIKDDIAKYMRNSGCHTVWMGIQTGDEGLRAQILNRPEKNAEIIDACKLIKESGIKLMVDHIFGIPFETNMSNDISIALYREIKPDVVNCYELLYFPKSKIIEHALKCGYLENKQVSDIEQGKHITYQVGNKTQHFYNTYQKGMISIPLGGITWELLPELLIKILVHLKAGRAFIIRVVIENEIFFTLRAILKKAGLWKV